MSSAPHFYLAGQRENCPVSPVGTVTGDGIVVLHDSLDGSTPFNMPLSLVSGRRVVGRGVGEEE